MTSEVLHSNVEATYITVETASFYGVKQKPSRVLVNSQDAVFTYRDNQVRQEVNRHTKMMENTRHAKVKKIKNKKNKDATSNSNLLSSAIIIFIFQYLLICISSG